MLISWDFKAHLFQLSVEKQILIHLHLLEDADTDSEEEAGQHAGTVEGLVVEVNAEGWWAVMNGL